MDFSSSFRFALSRGGNREQQLCALGALGVLARILAKSPALGKPAPGFFKVTDTCCGLDFCELLKPLFNFLN